jgi:hypothetical protein
MKAATSARRLARWLGPMSSVTFVFRLTGVVADLDDTTRDEPGHPSLALIIECGDDLARIVVQPSVFPLEKRELLAVDRPIAVTGESDVDPFLPGARAVATSLQILDSHHQGRRRHSEPRFGFGSKCFERSAY